jgi:hypothetical protein
VASNSSLDIRAFFGFSANRKSLTTESTRDNLLGLWVILRFLKKGKSLQDILQDEQEVDKNVEESCPDLF